MTRLTKDVRRVTGAFHRGREITVTLRPPSLIEFRLKGMRRRFTIGVVTAFELAVRIEAAAIAKQRAAERKAKRAERRMEL